MEGLYVCYSEKKAGNFNEAVNISNNEYLIWRHKKAITRRLKYPTKIVIKISGKDIYYFGDLLLVKDYSAFNSDIFIEDIIHRPTMWREPDTECKSVLFIANLRRINQPEVTKSKHPPQAFAYIDFS